MVLSKFDNERLTIENQSVKIDDGGPALLTYSAEDMFAPILNRQQAMSKFRSQSKSSLRNVSKAASWMMSRYVGPNHFWRSTVLTASNPDKSKRPIFDQDTSESIFQELIDRGLLVWIRNDNDGTSTPAYLMKHDIEGWDKAVADGRPVYGFFLKVRRNWLIFLLSFLLGCVVTTIQNRTVVQFDKAIDSVVSTPDKPQVEDASGGKMPETKKTPEGANKDRERGNPCG